MQLRTEPHTKLEIDYTARNSTIRSLVSFVLANRSNKVFKGWSETQINYHIYSFLEGGGLRYFVDVKTGNITGIVCAIINPISKNLYITNILCTSKDAIRGFVSIYLTEFPGYTISALRNGEFQTYTSTTKLVRLLYGNH